MGQKENCNPIPFCSYLNKYSKNSKSLLLTKTKCGIIFRPWLIYQIKSIHLSNYILLLFSRKNITESKWLDQKCKFLNNKFPAKIGYLIWQETYKFLSWNFNWCVQSSVIQQQETRLIKYWDLTVNLQENKFRNCEGCLVVNTADSNGRPKDERTGTRWFKLAKISYQ